MTEQAAPAFGDVLPYMADHWLDLPDGLSPYYVIDSEANWYLHRRTAQGRGIVKTTKTPRRLRKLDDGFRWDGAEIPATIYAQAVHFFRRIWTKHKTEAEVLITQHKTTKEYRLFVPTQRVSGTSVHSIYNPAHIDQNYLVVGTFHSHCDFSPFHSGTDESDARDMDGIHGTIGFVDHERPEIDLMYALNGVLFEWNPTEVDGLTTYPDVLDMTDLNAATAPEWWDRYVFTRQITDADRQTIAPYADEDTWKEFMGRSYYRASNVTHMTPSRPSENTRSWFESNGFIYDENLGGFRRPPLKESQDFNRRHEKIHSTKTFEDHDYGYGDWGYTPYTSPSWGDDGELLNYEARSNDVYKIVSDDGFWEDTLPKGFVNSLMMTDLFVEEDLERAIRDFPASGEPEYWTKRMRMKLFRAVGWMREQGFDVKVSITDPIKPVKGQTTVTGYLEAGDPA